MQADHILSLGYDRLLMEVRSMVLRGAGHHVQEVYSCPEALRLMNSDSIDIVLICHMVPDIEVNKLIRAIRTHRRLLPVLCLSAHEYSCGPKECVSVENSPLPLLEALKTVSRRPSEQYNKESRSTL